MSDSIDSSSVNLSETGGGIDITGDIMTVSSFASSCTICILCIVMIVVLANKSYCAH